MRVPSNILNNLQARDPLSCQSRVKIEKNCATVIVVKEGGKDVVYYFDEKSHKANHDAICQTGKQGTVTGTVSEKDGKKYIAVTKVAFNK